MNFSSKANYKKWLAYGHMNGDFAKTPGNQPVKIGGKTHKVAHVSHAVQRVAHHLKGKKHG